MEEAIESSMSNNDMTKTENSLKKPLDQLMFNNRPSLNIAACPQQDNEDST